MSPPSMRSMIQRLPSFLVVALVLLPALAGCGPDGPASTGFGERGGNESSGGPTSSGSSTSSGGSSGASSGGASSGGTPTGDGGVWTAPPPPQTPQPGGFQQTIAPLLDAQGCTECHHHGRPIDLTTYPFMAGSETAAASQLAGAFTSNMPPAPRTSAPQSVVDQVNAWIAAGMKP